MFKLLSWIVCVQGRPLKLSHCITLCYKFQKQLTFCCIEKRSLMRDHLRSMTFLSNGLFSLLGIKCIKCILKSVLIAFPIDLNSKNFVQSIFQFFYNIHNEFYELL